MGEAIAFAILKASMGTVEAYMAQALKDNIKKQSMEAVRQYLLVETAQQFSREVAFNAVQYVRALGESSVTIEVDGNPGEVLEQKFKKSIEEFENWIDNLPPDSPVVKRLLEVYGPKGGLSSYINRKPQSVWEARGFTKPRSEVWLNRTQSKVDVSDLLNEYASGIFDKIFGNSALSTSTISPNQNT